MVSGDIRIIGIISNISEDGALVNDINGAKAISPTAPLKHILFRYSKGLASSRRIEEATRTNIVRMALTGGLEPDFSTTKDGRADLSRPKRRYEKTVAKIDEFLAREKK